MGRVMPLYYLNWVRYIECAGRVLYINCILSVKKA